MSLVVTGKITKILPQESGQKKDGSGEWVKQNYILETNEQYNNLYCFEVFGNEKVENFNKYNKLGDQVLVQFNVNTNEWKGKYFTSLQSWRIEKVSKGNSNIPPNEAFEPATNLNEDDHDDLPF